MAGGGWRVTSGPTGRADRVVSVVRRGPLGQEKRGAWEARHLEEEEEAVSLIVGRIDPAVQIGAYFLALNASSLVWFELSQSLHLFCDTSYTLNDYNVGNATRLALTVLLGEQSAILQ